MCQRVEPGKCAGCPAATSLWHGKQMPGWENGQGTGALSRNAGLRAARTLCGQTAEIHEIHNSPLQKSP